MRAVKLIHSQMRALNLSAAYPPMMHALIFGHGKLGDIDAALSLYVELVAQHRASAAPLLSANITTTLLNVLAMYRRTIEAVRVFEEFLALPNVEPDLNNFAMMLKVRSLSVCVDHSAIDWRSEQ